VVEKVLRIANCLKKDFIMKQLEAARKGVITVEMKICAEREGVSPELSAGGSRTGLS
jgi:hypothetical protein